MAGRRVDSTLLEDGTGTSSTSSQVAGRDATSPPSVVIRSPSTLMNTPPPSAEPAAPTPCHSSAPIVAPPPPLPAPAEPHPLPGSSPPPPSVRPPPPPAPWDVHMKTNCYDSHGATSGQINSASSVTACQAACDSVMSTCQGIVVNHDLDVQGSGCWLIDGINLAECPVDDNYDVHIRPPTPPQPPLPRVPPAPPGRPPLAPGQLDFHPSQEACGLDGSWPRYEELDAPIDKYRGWWSCHQYENGQYTNLKDTFTSAAELIASPWKDYFDSVYGLSTLTYPLSIGSLVYFYTNLMPRGSAPWSLDANGYRYGEFTRAHYGHNGNDIWRAYRQRNTIADRYGANGGGPRQVVMSRGLPSYSMAEVTHACAPCDWQENGLSQGYWHYLQPGSGIFLNVGKTVTTESEWLGPQGCGRDGMAEAVQCLKQKGYDTWQRPHIFEAGVMLYEIVNVRDSHRQYDGCFDPWSYNPVTNGGRYYHGWDASRVCKCRSASALNCNG
eukprot:CAMPEP_0115834908 /NCGR_PEP_ID=MMETSP0287-20121206/3927_1 /TAXON_ID=412157 /ORGANISM="Chrysochromulina rotalis, Strain UIO044" /LENGTH=496 /DNA_ID=CAMNT_0003288361 /DNA_START=212 /DNA_END=1702 /DNA_ORIENTATION=+